MVYDRYYKMLANPNCNDALSENDITFFANHNLSFYVSSHCNIENLNKKDLLIQKLKFKKIIADLIEVTSALTREGIDYRVVKGIGIAMTYPDPYVRYMGDHDILVKPEDHERAIAVLRELGYNRLDGRKADVDTPLYRANSLKIELHYALFNKSEAYADEIMDMVWKKPIDLNFDKGVIRMPDSELHFRYMVIHIIKHFKYQGFGIRHLLDLIYFSKSEVVDIRSSAIYFDKIGYGVFYRAIIALCVYKLNMDINDDSWLPKKNEPYLETLSEFIAENGVFGFASKNSKVNHKYEILSGKNDWSRMSSLKQAFFPSIDLLSDAYGYAKKNKILLPVAWFQRFIRLAFRKDLLMKEKFFIFTKDSDAINKREGLMRILDLK